VRPVRLLWLLIFAAALVGAGLVVHSAMPAWYAKYWYPLDYVKPINREAAATGLDPALIAALIWRESGFDPSSKSHRGAVGLTQVLPSTATDIAAAKTPPVGRPSDLADPEVNIAYGAWYLRSLIDHSGGSVEEALAAYNAGVGNLARWKQRAVASGHTFQVPEDIPFPETKAYVSDVINAWAIYRRTYGDRLNPPT